MHVKLCNICNAVCAHACGPISYKSATISCHDIVLLEPEFRGNSIKVIYSTALNVPNCLSET